MFDLMTVKKCRPWPGFALLTFGLAWPASAYQGTRCDIGGGTLAKRFHIDCTCRGPCQQPTLEQTPRAALVEMWFGLQHRIKKIKMAQLLPPSGLLSANFATAEP